MQHRRSGRRARPPLPRSCRQSAAHPLLDLPLRRRDREEPSWPRPPLLELLGLLAWRVGREGGRPPCGACILPGGRAKEPAERARGPLLRDRSEACFGILARREREEPQPVLLQRHVASTRCRWIPPSAAANWRAR